MQEIPAKSILQTSKKSNYWFDYDYNVNLYRGCCHGCIYCDSRSECYQIENFDEVRIKANCSTILNKELLSKRKRGIVATGAMSDPYNPFEKKEQATRQLLSLLNAHRFGVSIATKSDLVLRDIDLLKKINEHSSVVIKMTITSMDDEMSKLIEPFAPVSSKRFEALKKLSDENLFCGILLMPVLPFVEDSEENIIAIVRKAAECGVKFIYPNFGVTLRGNQRDYFLNELNKIFPEIKTRYERAYPKSQYICASQNINYLYRKFSEECHRHNILYRLEDINKAFRKKTEVIQTSLF